MSQDRLINKINALYAKAASTEFPEEAAECMRLAEKLMLNHAIERSQLKAEPGEYEKEGVQLMRWDFPAPSGFFEQTRYLVGAVLVHCNIRGKFRRYDELELVGFESDINYAQQLWISVYREFAGNLFPTWVLSDDFDLNVYRHVKSGYKWRDIWYAATQAGVPDLKWPSGRFKAAYERHCKKIGEEPAPHTQRHGAFRTSYADAFQSVISARLRDMRKAAMEGDVEQRDKFALAVVDSMDQVNKEFYRLFPEYDPEVQAKRSQEARDAEEARRAAMTEEEREKEDRARERQYQKDLKWHNEQRNKAYDSNGWKRGSQVAKDTDLSGGRGHITPDRKVLD